MASVRQESSSPTNTNTNSGPDIKVEQTAVDTKIFTTTTTTITPDTAANTDANVITIDTVNVKKEIKDEPQEQQQAGEKCDDDNDNLNQATNRNSQTDQDANDDNNNTNDADHIDYDQNNVSDASMNDAALAICNSNDNNESNEESNENKTNLIVNYLPQQMTDEEFESLFEKFGEMKSCKIVRNRASGYSYGFGFVDFATHEQALKAIEELNGYELETKKIKVAFARPAGQDIKQANLYIKNIPNDWTPDQVRSHFEPYGNIIQVRVLGNNRGVAFVLYDLRKQAEDALEALNGKTIEGSNNPLEIKFAADKKSEKGGVAGKSNKGGNKSGGDNNSNNDNTSANEAGGSNPNAGKPVRKRERGHRGGRNQRMRMERRNQRAAQAAANNDGGGGGAKPGGGGGSYFDRRQNDNRQRSQNNRFNRNNQHNSTNNNAMYAGGPPHYGGGAPYNNQSNGIGPIRHMQATKMNRYTPFVPVQQMMAAPAPAVMASNQSAGGSMAQNPSAMAAAATYGYPTHQSMIPYAHLMSAAQPQMAVASTPMHPMTSQGTAAGQMHQQATPISMYSAAPSQLAHHPMAHYMMQPTATQSTINNMYSVAQNNLTNAANMQPQLGQTMNQHMRTTGGGNNEDGVTLFVYNIGPDSDENELRSMFGPYGQIVKCNVVRKTPGGETKGFGFVTMKDRDQASGAIAGLNGSMRNGRALQVSFKK